MAYSYTSLDKRLEKVPEAIVRKAPVTRYLATSPEEEELIRKAREIDLKETKYSIEDRVLNNEVVAEGIEIRYPMEVYKQEKLTNEITHRAFSGSGKLLNYIPLSIIVHKVTNRENLNGKLLNETTREEAITVTRDEIGGIGCAKLYNGFILNGNDVHRKLLEICVEQDNGEGPHLYVREVINDSAGERRNLGYYSTKGHKEGEIRYLDLNLASKPENIKAIGQSLEQVIEMTKKGNNPFLDEKVSKAILGVINSIENVSRRSENGVPFTEEFYKSLKIALPYYSKHLSEARK